MADFFSALEWLGLALGVSSVVLHVAAIYDSHETKSLLNRMKVNGAAMETVDWRIASEAVRLFISGGFAVVFLLGVFAPPTPSQINPSLQTWFIYSWQMVALAGNTLLCAYGFMRLARVRQRYAR